jgi:flavin reductase (DIM6/NTAB) family NADH-FMN oxidoreductase RutF
MEAARHLAAATLSDRVRGVHAQFPTGVTVVTTTADGAPYGLAVNAFASVSLDPAVVLFCVAKAAQTHAWLQDAEHAAVNILSHRQRAIATRFAQSGGDKFDSCEWHAGPHGSPIMEGVSAWLEVEVTSKADAATHTVFTGQVRAAGASNLPPLVYLAPGLFDGAQLIEAR